MATPVEIPATADVTIYVDPANPNASDIGPGTLDIPKATVDVALREAVDNRRNQLSTRILLAPGIYREELRYNGSQEPAPAAPIIIEAIEPGTVTFSAADVFTDWTRPDPNLPIYTHDWRNDWGLMDNPWGEDNENAYMAPIVRRREAVFVDGQPLRQVLARQELAPGTFVVSEANDTLTIWLEQDIDLGAATVDVAMREFAMRFENVDNLALRGLRFTYAAARVDGAPLVIRESSNILIEDSEFLWSNWAGFDIRRVNNLTIRDTVANHNGVRGMGAFRVFNLWVENAENNYNNWRGAMGDFNTWDSGQKFLLIHQGVFRNYRAEHNEGIGLWLDFDIRDVLVEGATLCDNYLAGLFIEAAPGPVVVRDSTICENRAQAQQTFMNGGVFSTNSAQVTLENNRIYGNEFAQVRLTEPDRFRTVTNFQTDESQQVTLEGWTLRGNLIATTRPDQVLIEVPGNGRTTWVEMLSVSGNSYYSPFLEEAFQTGIQARNLAQWQLVTGDDTGSLLDAPNDADIQAALEANATLGVLGFYYTNNDFTGLAAQRVESNINFDWFNDGPPEIDADDGYSAAWESDLIPAQTGLHTFYLRSTDPMRLFINGVAVAEQMTISEEDVEAIYVTSLTAGQPYRIRVEYTDPEGIAHAILLWSYGDQPKQVIPTRHLSVAALLPE
ncbi:hypothetical protein HC928_03015 [bacterium]|nr:hypothetical protein [bacterium]